MSTKVRFFSVDSISLQLLKSEPPQLAIAVTGLATTTGWTSPELRTIEDEVSPDGILDLEFAGVPPSGIVLQVLTPMAAQLVWEKDVNKVAGVKIHARVNEAVELLQPQRRFTTWAVGEEDLMPWILRTGPFGEMPGPFDPGNVDPAPDFFLRRNPLGRR